LVKELALTCGIAVAGITTADPFPEAEQNLESRRTNGHLDGMSWFTAERAHVSARPMLLHGTARSIISVGIPYYRSDVAAPNDGITRGRIARYAWGTDYHKTLKSRMLALVSRLSREMGETIEVRTLVDTARIVDRAVAARSGIGWFGKHTNIIVPHHGSFVMLGEILVDCELEPDVPLERTCGSCRICLDKCPTGAIVAPYIVSAPLCISFQTIEQRGPIPIALRPKLGSWVFGCDHCQDVCPYTGAARDMLDEAFAPAHVDNAWPSLNWLLEMNDGEFAERFKGTAVKRTKRAGLARNAAVALGNVGEDCDRDVLCRALRGHDIPLVRSHAAWALGNRYGEWARPFLEAGLGDPADEVREECRIALSATG
jgi:epoxyqueuosine reductase